MNKFAIVKEFKRYSKVTYYTICEQYSDVTEVDKFFDKMENIEDKFYNDVVDLIEWIEVIGEEHGAKEQYFRPENNAQALPPPLRYLESHLDIRLYCYRVSEGVVILFNGGIKTKNTAQECSNVSMHFRQAQIWSKKLFDIGIETSGNNITNIDDLYFTI